MTADTTAKEIFICYSRKDSEVVERIVDALEARGCRCWMDRHGIAGSDLWRHSIALALESARAVLFFASESSYQSLHVARELSLAEQKCHPILPLRLDRAPIPTGQFQLILAGIHYINYTAQDQQSAVEQIIASMAAITAARTGAFAAPASASSTKRSMEKTSSRAKTMASMSAFVLVAAAASYFTWKWADHRSSHSQPFVPSAGEKPVDVPAGQENRPTVVVVPDPPKPLPLVTEPAPEPEKKPLEIARPSPPQPVETIESPLPHPSAPPEDSSRKPASPGKLQPALDGVIEIRPPGS